MVNDAGGFTKEFCTDKRMKTNVHFGRGKSLRKGIAVARGICGGSAQCLRLGVHTVIVTFCFYCRARCIEYIAHIMIPGA